MQQRYDVLIVGGGFVGASLAQGLYKQGLSCAIIDIKVPKYDPISDNRGLALSASSVQILQQLDVWAEISAAATPIKTVHVSKTGCFGMTKLQQSMKSYFPKQFEEYFSSGQKYPQSCGLDGTKCAHEILAVLGYVINADQLGEQLHTKLVQNKITSFWQISAAKFNFKQDAMGCEVEFKCGVENSNYCNNPINSNGANSSNNVADVDLATVKLTANLIVAADGANSTLRDLQGIQVDRHDYAETAIICNVYTQLPHNNIAYERFTNMGTIALLPFTELKPCASNNGSLSRFNEQVQINSADSKQQYGCLKKAARRFKLVWTVAKHKAKELLALDEAEFLKLVQNNFGHRQGKFLSIGARTSFPLTKVAAQKLYADNMLLIGNAANTMHPVAAQGLNLGLRDVAVLLTILADARKTAVDGGMDIDWQVILPQYAAMREKDHADTQTSTHMLHSIFKPQTRIAKIVQGLCLVFANISPLINHQIMQRAQR